MPQREEPLGSGSGSLFTVDRSGRLTWAGHFAAGILGDLGVTERSGRLFPLLDVPECGRRSAFAAARSVLAAVGRGGHWEGRLRAAVAGEAPVAVRLQGQFDRRDQCVGLVGSLTPVALPELAGSGHRALPPLPAPDPGLGMLHGRWRRLPEGIELALRPEHGEEGGVLDGEAFAARFAPADRERARRWLAAGPREREAGPVDLVLAGGRRCERFVPLDGGEAGLVVDVTEVALLRRRLDRAESMLEQIEEIAFVGTWSWAPERDQVVRSASLEALLDGDGPGVPGASPPDWFSPEDRERIAAHLRAARAGRPFRLRATLLTAAGEARSCVVAGFAEHDEAEDVRWLHGTVVDVTEQQRLARELLRTESRFRAFMENCPAATFIKDGAQRYLFGNVRMAAQAGRSVDGLVGATVPELFPAATAERLARSDRRVLETGEPLIEEHELELADGSRRWFADVKFVLRDAVSGERLVGGFSIDVGRRRRAQALAERMQRAMEHASEMVMITDGDNRIEYVNPAFERVTGYRAEEVLGAEPGILRSGVHGPDFYQRMWGELSRGRSFHCRMVDRRKDGSLYTEDAALSPILEDDGRISGYVAVKRDVTELLARERELDRARRLEAVGQLASGIAHDFNNSLQVILVNAELALGEAIPEAVRESLTDIVDAAAGSSELSRQLLGFARSQPIDPQRLDLDEMLPRQLRFVERALGGRVRLRWEPRGDVPAVDMDPGQLEQVVTNLVVNARDAMPEGGTLWVASRRAEASDLQVVEGEAPAAGTWAVLEVADDGEGMDEATLERIFDPFFTTKGEGRGTGLGLASVFGIVKQNGGAIGVDSRPGAGTRFRVLLPAARDC
jgi:PAS domain S-box-containing protein